MNSANDTTSSLTVVFVQFAEIKFVSRQGEYENLYVPKSPCSTLEEIFVRSIAVESVTCRRHGLLSAEMHTFSNTTVIANKKGYLFIFPAMIHFRFDIFKVTATGRGRFIAHRSYAVSIEERLRVGLQTLQQNF